MRPRQIVVGDIHGCQKELQQLVEKLALTAADELILLGDLIDKGPNSAGVVNWLAALAQQQPITLIEGNHEERFLRWYRYSQSDPAKADQFAPAASYRHLLAQLSDAARHWLTQGQLWKRLTGGHHIAVHAGIAQTMAVLPPQHPLQQTETAKRRKHGYQLQHLRYIDSEGRSISLSQEQPHHRFWAEKYDGRFGHLIFGHQTWLQSAEPVRYKYATGIDLGCVHGGHLCALILEAGKETSWQTVAAAKIYASPSRNH
ncbi:MAG: serine/threonine protein phosphatase [Gammaproteobacteria bacterium]|nr:serine/threonine protein phosphatase [Gammaproteobacteria bacterium]